MKSHASLLRPLALGLAIVGLNSCSLPPSTAWRLIRQDGLGNYLAMEFGRKPFPPDVQSQRNMARVHTGNEPAVPWRSQQPIQSQYLGNSSAPAPVAPAPAPAPASASRMVFQVPAPLPGPAPREAPATATNRAPAKKSPVAKSSTKAQTSTAEAPAPKKAPSTVVASEPKKPAPAAAPAKKPAPSAATASATPKPAPKTTPAPASAPVPTNSPAKANSDLPYGTPVPGRVGLVHSPYAGKLQLVDVSGLSPGQEVKCPYSGKLFRVPTGDQAAAKPSDSTPPPAKTDDAKKQ